MPLKKAKKSPELFNIPKSKLMSSSELKVG